MTARLRALLARPCRCGHAVETHEHYRPGSDCGACGCPRYRRAWLRPEPVDLAAVCRDHQLVEAVLDDRIDHALLLAPASFVAALVALRDAGRAAA